MVDTAMQNGINYYDTAWGYHGENSETVMGKALARYPRDSFYVATKFPGYDASKGRKIVGASFRSIRIPTVITAAAAAPAVKPGMEKSRNTNPSLI